MARRLGSVVLHQAALGPVSLAGRDGAGWRPAGARAFPPAGPATVDLGGVRARRLVVQANAVRGEGFNRVGLAEVEVAGVRLSAVARMPTRLADLAADLDDPARAALARTPLDVLMTRAAGRPGTADDDEERRLLRDFRLPDQRSFRAGALVRVGPGLSAPSSTRWRDTGGGSSRSPRRGLSTRRRCAHPAPSTATRQPPGHPAAGQASGSHHRPTPADQPRRRRAGRVERRRPPGRLGDPGRRAGWAGGGQRGHGSWPDPHRRPAERASRLVCEFLETNRDPLLSTWSGSARWPSAVPGCATGSAPAARRSRGWTAGR